MIHDGAFFVALRINCYINKFSEGEAMLQENKKLISIWYTLSFCIITIGVIAGAVYYTYKFTSSAEIKNYIDGYTNSLRNGMDLLPIIKSSFKSYMIIFLGIAISMFFKHGYLLSFFLICRAGFINSFTISSMVDVYGGTGLLLALSSIIQILVIIPLLALYTAVAYFFSKKRKELGKREKIIYIIFFIAIFTIFSGCSALEGIITTTFMKWLAFKVT